MSDQQISAQTTAESDVDIQEICLLLKSEKSYFIYIRRY